MDARRLGPLAVCLLALAGCANHAQLHRALQRAPAPSGPHLLAGYVVRCPDVLDVTGPQVSGRFVVGPDGRLDAPGRPRVAGLTAPAIAALLSRAAGSEVTVRVAEHRSQFVYVVGEVAADRQAVAYRGPETVVELLQRVGLSENAALAEVTVVRAHVADGKPPEVFRVDLRAILSKRDDQTNVRLAPSDHVHVEQRRPSRLATCLHPILRAPYEAVFGVK